MPYLKSCGTMAKVNGAIKGEHYYLRIIPYNRLFTQGATFVDAFNLP